MFAGDHILFEKTSAISTIVVSEDESGLRTLRFGRDGVRQSVVKPGDPAHVELAYARALLVSLVFVSRPSRLLVLGLGLGTIASFLHHHFPEAVVEVVEIDPVVASAAREWGGVVESDRLRVVVEDGRRFLEHQTQLYDLIVMDAFGEVRAPCHLTTREFLKVAHERLTSGGAMATNLWTGRRNPEYESMLCTYQDEFQELWLVDVPGADNKIGIALPRHSECSQSELVVRCQELSAQRQFRFDLGRFVTQGSLRWSGMGTPHATL